MTNMFKGNFSHQNYHNTSMVVQAFKQFSNQNPIQTQPADAPLENPDVYACCYVDGKYIPLTKLVFCTKDQAGPTVIQCSNTYVAYIVQQSRAVAAAAAASTDDHVKCPIPYGHFVDSNKNHTSPCHGITELGERCTRNGNLF
jgi:hypothetical protein